MTVRVEDKQDDPLAKKLGIADQGYPNVAVYDAESEYLGRVVGFGGKDPWFQEVKDVVQVGETLAEAKKKAAGDPAKWVDVAEVLKTIPDRAKDALAALEKVPAKAKKSKQYKAAEASIGARVAWSGTESTIDDLMKEVRSREAAQEVAPKAIEALDAFLKAHQGADKETDPAALAKKGFFLMLLDRAKEAVPLAKKILEEYPDSQQAKALLGGLR